MKLLGFGKSKKDTGKSEIARARALLGKCNLCDLKNFSTDVEDPIPGERNKDERFKFIKTQFTKDVAIIEKT